MHTFKYHGGSAHTGSLVWRLFSYSPWPATAQYTTCRAHCPFHRGHQQFIYHTTYTVFNTWYGFFHFGQPDFLFEPLLTPSTKHWFWLHKLIMRAHINSHSEEKMHFLKNGGEVIPSRGNTDSDGRQPVDGCLVHWPVGPVLPNQLIS